MIPYGHQSISEDDIQAVVDVLRSDRLTQGPVVPRFEGALASYCGVDHVVAVSNGTVALHLACLALGLGPGQTLWTVPTTFAASANCALYCGASVDFVDIDPDTWSMSTAALARKLEEAAASDALPAVVVPVHLAGQSCDMRAIGELAETYGFAVLEDACHALGGTHDGRPVGSCAHSDAAVFSFHPVKSITTGEGGAIATRDEATAERMRLLRSHGITRDPALLEAEAAGPWYYEQVELGYNHRITDIQAALGASQLLRLDGFVERRSALAARYDTALEDMPVSTQASREGSSSARHIYVVRIAEQTAGVTRDAVLEGMAERGVGSAVHYLPVHLHPYYRRLGFEEGRLPEAERYGSEALTIPLFVGLDDGTQDVVIAALADVLG